MEHIERPDKWTEVGPEEVGDYTLPEGVVEQCRIEDEVDNPWVGTNQGVYTGDIPPRYEGVKREKVELQLVGLKEYSIVELEVDNEILTAKTDSGQFFRAPTYLLTGMR